MRVGLTSIRNSIVRRGGTRGALELLFILVASAVVIGWLFVLPPLGLLWLADHLR